MTNNIEIRPRLKGGSSELKIICTNVNGYPSSKNLQKKVPTILNLIKDQDMAIILETGINE